MNNRSALTPIAAGGGLVLMIICSALISLHGYGFQLRLSGDPSFHARFDAMPVASTMHVLGGATVLLVGGFQFWQGLRNRWPAFHRNLGRVYLALVVIGGIGGLLLAPVSAGGLVAHFGFGLLAVLWLYSGWQAYSAIRRRDVATHRAWMMRNFAMTFGAVTLRIYLGILQVGFDVAFLEAYQTVAWISWVPNLILVEWYLTAKSGTRSRASSLGAPGDTALMTST